MVGLSIVLEERCHHHQEGGGGGGGGGGGEHYRHRNATAEVISKTNMSMVINNPRTGTGSSSSSSSNPSSPSSSSSSAFLPAFPIADFLNQCFLCRAKLSPWKDIYMYRGDRAFCSEECRYRQILLDEEEAFRRENQNQSHCSSAAHPSSTRNGRGTRNIAFDGM